MLYKNVPILAFEKNITVAHDYEKGATAFACENLIGISRTSQALSQLNKTISVGYSEGNHNTWRSIALNTVYIDIDYIDLQQITSDVRLNFTIVPINDSNIIALESCVIDTPEITVVSLPAIAHYEYTTYSFSVSRDGAASLTGTITLKFTNGTTIVITVVGTRAKQLSLVPEETISYKVSYNTQISKSMNKELRAMLAEYPDIEVTYKYIVAEYFFEQVLQVLRQEQSLTTTTVLWDRIVNLQNIQQGTNLLTLDATSIKGFVGCNSIVLLGGDSLQFAQVASIEGNAIRLTSSLSEFERVTIAPVYTGYKTTGSTFYRDYYNKLFTLNTTEKVYNCSLHLPTTNDYLMLNNRLVFNKPIASRDFANKQDVTLMRIAQSAPFINIDKPKSVYEENITLQTTDYAKFLQIMYFVDYTKGSFNSFWITDSVNENLTLAEDINTANLTKTLVIDEGIKVPEKDKFGIYIKNELGEEYCYQIDSVGVNSKGKTTLLLDKNIESILKMDRPHVLKLLRRVRVKDDSFDVTLDNYYTRSIKFAITEVL